MTEAIKNHDEASAQRPPQPMSGPFLEFDLDAEIELLRREPAYQRGRNSKTLLKYPDLRVVLSAIRRGERIREHTAAGRITIHSVAGHIRAHVGPKLLDLPAGRLLVLDRAIPHDIEAVEDSAFLITFAWQDNAGLP